MITVKKLKEYLSDKPDDALVLCSVNGSDDAPAQELAVSFTIKGSRRTIAVCIEAGDFDDSPNPIE